jgi:HSP20 family protein
MKKNKLLSKIIGLKNYLKTDTSKQNQSATAIETAPDDQSHWVSTNSEGHLSVDMYQTDDAIIIKSAVAGVAPEDIDISFANDMITVRGSRMQSEIIPEEDYIYQECYWGTFSRSIILPVPVMGDKVIAEFKQGILTITLPKSAYAQTVKIAVEG